MSVPVKNIKNALFFVIALAMYVVLIFFTYKYEMNPYLIFDEAGQFWMAQGLNHDSPALSPVGGVLDVIRNNQNYNFDPGGYSIIMHLWNKVSTHYLWMRSLSFVFFLLTVAGFGYLTYQWTRNVYIAVCASLVPFLIPTIYRMSFFVRAYSMEVLGCVVCAIAMHRLQLGVMYKRLIGYSLLIAFFMTSRWSFVIIAFLTSLYVLWLIYKSEYDNRKRWMMALVYSVPLVAMVIVEYCVALRYQNPSLQPLDWYLPYLYVNGHFNWQILFWRNTLIFFFCIAIVVRLTIYYKNSVRACWGVLFVTISASVVFFLLACVGVHPWDSMKLVSMDILLAISLTAFGCNVLQLIQKKLDARFFLLALICLLLTENFKGVLKIRKTGTDTLTELRQISPTTERVFVDNQESPFVRYLYEYGELKGSSNYPQDVTFTPYRKHGFNTGEEIHYGLDVLYTKYTPSMDEMYDMYDVLIIPDYYRCRPQKVDGWKSVNKRNVVWVKNMP